MAGLAREASYLWGSDVGSGYPIRKMTTPQGTQVDYSNQNDPHIKDLAYDGTHLWAINTDGVLKKFDISSKKLIAGGTLVDSISGLLTGGWGLTWGDGFLWASNPNTDRIYQISITPTTTYSISGYAKDSTNTVIQNVAMTLSGNTRTTVYTNSTGYYEFTGLAEDDYTVTPNKDGWIFEPSQISYTPLNSNQTNQNYVGTLEEVILELEPDATSVLRGGTLGYRVYVTNNMSNSKTFYYYTNVTLPNSNTYPSPPNWLFSYGTVTVPSGETRDAHVVHNVPNAAPIGGYTYNAFIGWPGDIWNEDHFDFTVSTAKNFPSLDYETDWNVIENGFDKTAITGTMSSSPSSSLPTKFLLHQNQPNPFNSLTTISYSLAKSADDPYGSATSLKIYNIYGRLVKTFDLTNNSTGSDGQSLFNQVVWDGKDDTSKEVPSGVYFYWLQTGSHSDTKKMTFMR